MYFDVHTNCLRQVTTMFNTRMNVLILCFVLAVSAGWTSATEETKFFLNYLDEHVLLPCEITEHGYGLENLLHCINVTYHLKKMDDPEVFEGIEEETLDHIETYFETVVDKCWKNGTHLEFNHCVKEEYYEEYGFSMTVADHATQEFLEYLDDNVLQYCETSISVQEANLENLLECIEEQYEDLKNTSNPFGYEDLQFDSPALRRLEEYFGYIVYYCMEEWNWNDYSEFNDCVAGIYFKQYGYDKRKLKNVVSRLLRILKESHKYGKV